MKGAKPDLGQCRRHAKGRSTRTTTLTPLSWGCRSVGHPHQEPPGLELR